MKKFHSLRYNVTEDLKPFVSVFLVLAQCETNWVTQN